MAVNTLTFNQLSTLLNSINRQATGVDNITPTNAGEFVSVATSTLMTGYDTVINAVSQVLSRTIFSIRPYNRKFAGLDRDSQQWGNHVRKLNVVDDVAQDDQRIQLEDEAGIDQQKVRKPKIVQTNFYGANVWQRSVTLFKDQLDVAFSGPEEFGSFISMVMQNVSDMIEMDRENTARATVANLIGGTIAAGGDNVIHLVSEYNDATGLTLDSDTVKKPENFTPFWRWAWARIKTVSDLLTERSTLYHQNITGKPISRHTPHDRQMLYMYAADVNNAEASVLSNTYHDNYLQGVDFERVNFWQSIKTPMGIQVKPTYMTADGTLTQPSENVTQSNILGVLFDEEAAGVTVVNEWTAAAPFNAAGGYTNTYWHYTHRYYNDFTENVVVFLMD